MTKIVGLDVGNDVSVAVVMTLDDYQNFPPGTNSEDFYNSCDFHYLKPDIAGLTTLRDLGDIYVFEPTGNYSRIWHNNLLDMGKEVRLLPHNKAPLYRDLCGWDYKDDEHDSIAIAYYGWMNKDNPRAYNRVRLPVLHKAYQKILEKERLVRELRTLKNRARNRLHTEFPEARNSRSGGQGNIKADPIWTYISGNAMGKVILARWQEKQAKTIGTAKNGFSTELISLSQRIYILLNQRVKIIQELSEVLNLPEFDYYKEVFDAFQFGTFDRIIILCQIHPFSQFLDDDLKEIRIEKKRLKGKSGKCKTRRVAYNRFHSFLGKSVKPWSSGKKDGHIVTGSTLARNHLYLWATRNVVMQPKKGEIFEILRTGYDRDMTTSTELLNSVKKLEGLTEDQTKSIKELGAMGDLILSLIEESKATPKAGSGKQRLGAWAKSRISDKAVKMLFKALIGAYRKEMNS